jgi:ABC-type antimicrobial peptide transport system permease subunit
MWRDLVSEALAAMLARPQRTALTALGTLVGIATLVTVSGVASTAGAQIINRFDELAATTVTVVPAESADSQATVNLIPWDAPERLQRLNGVVAAGTLTPIPLSTASIRATVVNDPLAPTAIDAHLVAASPGLDRAVRGQLAAGRFFDAGHDQRGDAVAVVGRNVAAQLQLGDLRLQPAVFVDDRPYTVIGVLDSVERAPSLLSSVIVPNQVARDVYGVTAPESVIIETAVGAANLIRAQAPIALAPQQPEALTAVQPPEPAATRARISDDVRVLFLVLGAVSLVIGGVGIASTTLVSVIERTGEIGLRRSLGASRRHIAALFVVESGLTGLLGAIVGASTGVLLTVAIAATQRWTPVLDGWLPPAAAALGALIGVLAGLYPAWRAAHIEPIAALRAHT